MQSSKGGVSIAAVHNTSRSCPSLLTRCAGRVSRAVAMVQITAPATVPAATTSSALASRLHAKPSTRPWVRLFAQHPSSGEVSPSDRSSRQPSMDLESRPVLKRPRLAPPPGPAAGETAPPRLRRWHRVAAPKPAEPGAAGWGLPQQPAAVPGPRSAQPLSGQVAAASTPARPPQFEPKAGRSGTGRAAGGAQDSVAGWQSARSLGGFTGDSGSRRERSHQQQQQQGQGQGRGWQQGNANPDSKTLKGQVVEDDGSDEEEEDRDGEFAGLSEEELERMVFASARAATATGAPPASSSGQRAPAEPRIPDVKAAATSAAPQSTIEQIVGAAALPPQLHAALLAAVQSGAVSRDAGILTEQLSQLRTRAAATAAAGTSAATPASAGISSVGPANADAAHGSGSTPAVFFDAATGTVVAAQASALEGLLACGPPAAVAALVNQPALLVLSRKEANARLRFLRELLEIDLGSAQAMALRNPALLLAGSEPLRHKLTALRNATGLPLAQAAEMVTAYMFPQV